MLILMGRDRLVEERLLGRVAPVRIKESVVRDARILGFPGRHRRAPVRRETKARVAPRPEGSPQLRLLRAVEMERRGFVDGAIAQLRRLCGADDVASDPRLAIASHYFLASFLMLCGNLAEARRLAEDGIFLAWEHGAEEELELLDNLSRQLEDEGLAERP